MGSLNATVPVTPIVPVQRTLFALTRQGVSVAMKKSSQVAGSRSPGVAG